MLIVVECADCKKTTNVVLGTKTKEEKPLAKCPECKSGNIKIVTNVPKVGTT
jgi:Zn finger protein HypA/HybF involved in hydrogenase expression